MRDAFFSEVASLFRKDERFVFITGDLGYKLFDVLAEIDCQRVINFGIREPSMIGYAAGLSHTGLRPVTYSIVPFLVLRCLEQIKLDLCYNQSTVVMVGVGGGLAYGPNGPSHHGPDDVGVLGVLPGMRVLTPGDSSEVRACVQALPRLEGPTYLRLGRNKEPLLSETDLAPDRIGEPRILTHGPDGVMICYGPLTYNVLKAQAILRSRGVNPTIVHLITLRPFPEEGLLDLLNGGARVLTVEEHVPLGGLGHQVAALIATHGLRSPFKMLTLPDRFPEVCFDHAKALQWAGLDPDSIANAFCTLMESPRIGGTG